MIYKKAIGPVVATALLLVVSVVSVVGFFGWFEEFSSRVFVDVETKSSSSSSLSVESIVGNKLYFNAGESSTISKVIVAGRVCMNSSTEYSGINSIDVSSCLADVLSGSVEVLIFRNDDIISEYVYLDKTSGSFLDCGSLVGGEWVKITSSGIGSLVSNDFCVMKYESKENVGNANSVPAGTPWVSINQNNAKIACSNLGTGYKLITNSEWTTIARIIEDNPINWNSSIVGVGGIYRGNVNLNDSLGCTSDSILDVITIETNCIVGTRNKRVLNISGEIIWDLSGNVWEWNSDIFDNNEDSGLNSSSGWKEWNTIDNIWNYLKPLNISLTSINGIGKVYPSNSNTDDGTVHSFIRGGRRGDGDSGGIFTLSLFFSPSSSSPDVGFRCTYSE